tara:strand:- start:303 stop:1139 length:837 start_codon:yes stop_codon:yes gene_type:complete
MVFKSFSKVNLSLTVNKRLKNGLHQIQSYFCLIDLFDEIKIKKNRISKDEIKFSGKFSKNINKKDNTVVNTLRLLRKKKLINNYYSVDIKKHIPVFAGLGGGSSNAFYLAKILLKRNISKKVINIMNKEISTDCNLFFHNQGFLENLKNIKTLNKRYKLFFLLVYPNIRCSTRYVYSRVKKHSPKIKFNSKTSSNKKKYIDFLTKSTNDLQFIIEKKYPTIRNLLFEIRQTKGCYFSRMTGSGSVCYGVFQSKKSVLAALNKIKSKYPKYWTTFAKTI